MRVAMVGSIGVEIARLNLDRGRSGATARNGCATYVSLNFIS